MAFSLQATGLQARIRTGLGMVIQSLTKTYGETADTRDFESAQNQARAVIEEGAILKVMANPPAKANLVQVIASAAQTATQHSADQTNVDARGVVLALNITVYGTSAAPVMTLERKNPDGTYTTIMTCNALTAVGSLVAIFDPLVGTTLAGIDTCTDGVLPQTWRVTVTPGSANSTTYSVAAYLIR